MQAQEHIDHQQDVARFSILARRRLYHRARPFLKWAGGKTQLLPEILARVPTKFDAYIEPFVGGGAVFFALAPHYAHLADINSELINAYTTLRDSVDHVIEELCKLTVSEGMYYRIRAWDPSILSPAKRAARLIYLNRTCFNGLYRVNKSGQFNVPFGRYDQPVICHEENLQQVSKCLRSVQLTFGSAFDIMEQATAGDFIYLDPPYQPRSRTSSFAAYDSHGFGWVEQEKLAAMCRTVTRRGVYVLLSNSDTPEIEALYKGLRVERVLARRAINSRGMGRGKISEVLIRNY